MKWHPDKNPDNGACLCVSANVLLVRWSPRRRPIPVNPPACPCPSRDPTLHAPTSHTRPNAPGEEAAANFQAIGEAYDVLSDVSKKAIYDQYGYEALRDGIPDGSGGMSGGYK